MAVKITRSEDKICNIYFEFFDEVGYLGSLKRCGKTDFAEYEAVLYLEALYWLKSMLTNANKFLFANKNKIPREVYATKLLDRMNIEGSNQTFVPKRTRRTYEIIEPYRNKYILDACEDDRFELILDVIESSVEKHSCEHRVYVRLDTKFAMFEGFFKTMDFTDYCKITGCETSEVLEVYNGLSEIPALISRPDFNNLDDAYLAALNNASGFRGVLSETIVLIK